MNEDDSTRYTVAMAAYIRHLAEYLKFWRGRDHLPEQEKRAQQRLDDFLETYRRHETASCYEDLRRELKEILGDEQ